MPQAKERSRKATTVSNLTDEQADYWFYLYDKFKKMFQDDSERPKSPEESSPKSKAAALAWKIFKYRYYKKGDSWKLRKGKAPYSQGYMKKIKGLKERLEKIGTPEAMIRDLYEGRLEPVITYLLICESYRVLGKRALLEWLE